MATTYHSVIGTVKLQGSSAWVFIGTFFHKIFNCCRDYQNLIPAKISLANGGDATKLGHYYKKYVWALVNKLENVTYFFYDNEEDDSCGSRPIETFLGSFLGSIQSDGYVVYKHLAEVTPHCEFILCWAHVRNKFAMTFEANKDADAEWFVQ